MKSPKATLVWASGATATGLPMSTLAAESIGASPLSSTLPMAAMCAITTHSAETMQASLNSPKGLGEGHLGERLRVPRGERGAAAR
eukprot:362475-Alexandrium_andersonii.AAC.1